MCTEKIARSKRGWEGEGAHTLLFRLLLISRSDVLALSSHAMTSREDVKPNGRSALSIERVSSRTRKTLFIRSLLPRSHPRFALPRLAFATSQLFLLRRFSVCGLACDFTSRNQYDTTDRGVMYMYIHTDRRMSSWLELIAISSRAVCVS